MTEREKKRKKEGGRKNGNGFGGVSTLLYFKQRLGLLFTVPKKHDQFTE